MKISSDKRECYVVSKIEEPIPLSLSLSLSLSLPLSFFRWRRTVRVSRGIQQRFRKEAIPSTRARTRRE